MFLAEEVLCMCGDGICGSEKIVGYIKGSVWQRGLSD